MKTEIEAAMKTLTEKAVADNTKSHEALQFTQAALNLAHALATLRNAN